MRRPKHPRPAAHFQAEFTAFVDRYLGQRDFGRLLPWALLARALVWLTLAIVPVRSNRMEQALEALWPQVTATGLPIGRVLLDRGFCGGPAIRWLQDRSIRFLMPLVRRGRAPRPGRPGSGTAPFFGR